MGKEFDAVIVGAGLGGLTAAARLLGDGLRVLVVESDPHPGGTAYTYRRKGFGFPMGPLGFSSPGVVGDVLRQVGIEDGPQLVRVHYRLHAFGLEAPLSLPYGEMITALAALFPREEAAISRFFGHMQGISAQRERLVREGASSARREESISGAAYLDRLVVDWRLRRILGSMGSREPYSGTTLLAAMWSLLCDQGIHYPEGGLRRLSDTLAAGLGWEPGAGWNADSGDTRSSLGGGSLLLRTRVAGIAVEGGRAAGVVLADGTRLEAGAVISNADFKATLTRLVPREAVPGDLYEAVSSARQTSSNLQVCLGLDGARADLSAFRDASRIIYRRDTGGAPPDDDGPDWDAPETDPHALAGEELEAALLSADDPSLAPGGRAVLVIRVAVPHRHFARFRPAPRRRTPGYFAYKAGLAAALVKEVAVMVPGLEGAVLCMDVATPLTFEERGGRSEGAVAGWSWDFSEGEAGSTELIRTPVAGLYMAGYQAYSMLALGGVPSAMLSGLKAAEYLLAGAGPVSAMPIPGAPVA
ncbi:MAG: NAD(P)/FAD-dependent oxidoreductase [Actinomycetota bacterium]